MKQKAYKRHCVNAEELKEFKDAGKVKLPSLWMILKQQIQNLTAGAIRIQCC